jgi:Mg2+ and Co2+ transporter CorA
MLSAFPITSDLGKSLTGASWIDLVDPTPTEIAGCEKAFGLRVPTSEELSEIE